MLILALEPDRELAVDTVIHVWYSARIKPKHAEILLRIAAQLTMGLKKPGPADDRTSFIVEVGTGSVTLTLDKIEMLEMADYIVPALNDDDDSPRQSRFWCCMSRIDPTHQPLVLFSSRLHRRVAKANFRKKGILLPFGDSEAEFCVYNP